MRQPRARGHVRLSIKPGSTCSAIDTLHQAGSLKVLFPRTDAGLQAVLVNTAGGVTGGDRFETSVTAAAETTLTLTTQAAERAYRARAEDAGRITTKVTVAPGARVNWLPQETLLFDGCHLRRTLHVDLSDASELTLVEPLVFGRAAMGETLSDAQFQDNIAINRSGTPLFLDRMTLTGDIAAHLAGPSIADGAGALATVVHVSSNAESHLDHIRNHLPCTAGASLVRDDVLVIRALAPDSFELRRFLIPILTHLIGDDLPRPWMI
jgi:urease accessory protein